MTPEKKREYDRAYHARRSPEAKARKLALQHARLLELRAVVAAYKSTKACGCGEADPVCLDFHHPADDKLFNISDATRWGISKAVLITEMEKCVVLCANCHRKLHR